MEARVGEERGRGIPLSDVERVMRHYNIDEATARYYLTVHPIEILLPERGYGLTEAIQPPISGPRPIGLLAAIAIGAYTSLEAIIAPTEAAYGALVTVETRVRNLYSEPIYIAVTGHYDGVDIFPTEDYAIVDPGATYSFYFSFTMPNSDVRLDVWSFYWTGTEWYQDDHDYVNIALAAMPEPEFRGFGVKEYNKT